jgi:hypothetical protein
MHWWPNTAWRIMTIAFAPSGVGRGFVRICDRFLFTTESQSVIEPPHSPVSDRDDGWRIMRFRYVALIVLWTMLSGPVMVQPQAGSTSRATPIRAAGAAKPHNMTVSAKPKPTIHW